MNRIIHFIIFWVEHTLLSIVYMPLHYFSHCLETYRNEVIAIKWARALETVAELSKIAGKRK